ncbi:acetylglutamate kinase [Aliikangiella sp. IMCC44653]
MTNQLPYPITSLRQPDSNLSDNHYSPKKTILQLLENLATPQEIKQYLTRFMSGDKMQFAVIKVGGEVLSDDLESLCNSLAFLVQIGLFPIIVHGAGKQLSAHLSLHNIPSKFIHGERVTDTKTLALAKQVFLKENTQLANKLQTIGVKAVSLSSGIFTAKPSHNQQLGLVGEVTQVNLQPIQQAIANDCVPIVSCLAETEQGQTLNINADMATSELAIALNPYKIIFLTPTGGILDENKKIISSINLVTDYSHLLASDWLKGGMKLKLIQIATCLSRLPTTTSVSITTPSNLAKELFTHKGSGTLVRRGESIMLHDSIESIKTHKLKNLIETSFAQTLSKNYFESSPIEKAIITYSYRAAAVLSKFGENYFLDKFVVAPEAKGEGLGKVVWKKLLSYFPEFFWRSRITNPINQFYYSQCDGCRKHGEWIVFWIGLKQPKLIEACFHYAINKPTSLIENITQSANDNPQCKQTPVSLATSEASDE